MYPEEGAGDVAPAPRGIKSRLAYNLEGIIPLVLILIIAFFVAVKLGFLTANTPFIGPVVGIFTPGEQPVNMLIIGQPSVDLQILLDEEKNLVKYRVKSAIELERNPKDQLAQYDIVMLDQHTQADKIVSRALGEAIENYVKTGGKLIVVMDSGIRRKDAADVIGWEATFGDIVPVDCEALSTGEPSCLSRATVRGLLFRNDFDHPIMKGIEKVPADPSLGLIMLDVLDVASKGNEIAYVQDAKTPAYYTGIVEAKLLIGKSIYFNYDPGRTRGIFENTIEYLR